MASKKQSYPSAFTIVELLVVIVVIGILASITIVSYTGITTKANIANMQSDLSNASTKLRLYQAENSILPATAADAITAKLISPSPSMDYYSYNVDNVSNPQYFCYMYRKGTDVYAVDSNSAPSKGVCLTNIITNGDFSSGTTGWSVAKGTYSVSNNTLYNTGNGDATWPISYQNTGVAVILGHIYYVRAKMRVSNSFCNLITLEKYNTTTGYGSGSGITSQSSPVQNQWYVLSGLKTDTVGAGSVGINLVHSYTDAATANGKVMEVQYVLAFDLTAIFGIGYEPTKAQIDTIVSGYPNSWFDKSMKASL